MLRRTNENALPRTCAEVRFPGTKSCAFLIARAYVCALVSFQRVPTLYAVTIFSLVPGVTIGAGIEQRATARTEIYIRFIWAFTIGA